MMQGVDKLQKNGYSINVNANDLQQAIRSEKY